MDLIEYIERFNEFVNQSYLVKAFKFFLGFYLILLVLTIIGIAYRFWPGYTRVLFHGAGYRPEIGKFQRRWNKVNKQIDKDDPAGWAAAVLECSQMLNEVLKAIGYEGDNLGERLEKLLPSQINDIEKLKVVNEVKNHLVQNPDFRVTQEEAAAIRDAVGRVLDNYEMIEFDE